MNIKRLKEVPKTLSSKYTNPGLFQIFRDTLKNWKILRGKRAI
ncbi:hypothetical protein AM1_C0095 (plasmid) [Acaryochloris marina MBIC11017]|uniref:Uncharacterized protein n=1 Tax=Acaryochloris marina (strain MBIC 11017) TaxID=329726 RepID=A8ZMJ2_ACAM1|nr:hypothetical protein AM1_C0095 [Acaryochloris marina MBIC11017]